MAAALGAQPVAAKPSTTPVKLIFDTDFGGDVDDAGVAGMLNAMQDNGEVEVLAMMASNPTRHAAPGLDAINTYYGHGNIPIGSLKPVYDHVPSPPTPGAVITSNNVSGYAELLGRGWKNNIGDSSRVPDAVDLYRKILAKQDDASVTIVAVGGQINLGGLLASGPDQHSPLTGAELVSHKVNKLVVMGARFPSGREWNIMLDPTAAATVAKDWPTPIVYSGFEIGDTILTGSRLFTETHPNNPVLNAYEDYVGWGNNRSSWDLTAAYVAVRGTDELFKLSEPGQVKITADGSNTFQADPSGTRHYLLTAAPDETIAKAIEDLMVQAPVKGWH
ncbi:nucleoside hydrolase [Micromonospora sp. DR5-3]|uniref:nucleoside hydrolase n=1 Tax=unclassified Micromonospora TaxID=2617518 RepID=UPI0016522C64|nr:MULTISPECIES: nucleoside hydrolase [unclassified Micromonospora]MCW3819049.1 nucleoside hydrolase [Micromonospora sp. DR5-3]